MEKWEGQLSAELDWSDNSFSLVVLFFKQTWPAPGKWDKRWSRLSGDKYLQGQLELGAKRLRRRLEGTEVEDNDGRW